MVRKQVYIEPRQEILLKRLSREMHVPQAELIRQGIDRVVQGGSAFQPDPAAVERERRYLDWLVRNRPFRFKRWCREDLYDR